MKVLVLGGGVIGVTSAYYLARQGCEVTLVERQPDVALETSFANAGQVSPGYSTPWAAPGIPLKALKWLFQRHAPLAIRPDGSLFQLRWMAAMLAQCTAGNYARNKARMVRLAEYSRDSLRQLRAETGITYEQRSGGTLQLFRTEAQWSGARRDTALLDEYGVPYRLLEAEALPEVEPGLRHARANLVGGLYLPNDETGDCQRFTQALARQAKALGVEFRLGHSVNALLPGARGIAGVRLDGPNGEVLRADQVVLACGSYSRALLQPLGLDLPVYPVKGYSLTLPLLDATRAPVSTVLDETYKIAITRFDQRIRVGGMAELAGFDLRLNPRRRETLAMVVQDLFDGGDLPKAEFWTGLRPMTPDSTPLVGRAGPANLFLNTGHGTLGWTMACGSGRLLADLVCGRTPDIDTEGLDLARYRRPGARAALIRNRPLNPPQAA